MDSKIDIAKKLTRLHAEMDNGITLVRYIMPDKNVQSVTVLEVNEHAIPSGTIVPVPLGPSGDIPHSTTVIEVTPEEYTEIEEGTLRLPEGWELGEELFLR